MAAQIGTNAQNTAASPAVPLYHLSSQFRHWRYSTEQLEQIRKELNEQAIERVRKSWEEERASRELVPPATPAADGATPSTTSAPPSQASPSQPATPPEPSEIEYLTVADEQALVGYYLTQVVALCGALKFPEMVLATAITYLKRFYLRNTCMDYHPKNIMLTCVFLTTKTEDFPTSIDTFAARVKTPPADILSLEFLVSQSLHFEYKVHHAHLALSGLVLDLQTAGCDASSIASALPRAQAFCRTSRLTPAELVYTPSQIALACLRLADPSLVDTWLSDKDSRRGKAEDDRKEKQIKAGGNDYEDGKRPEKEGRRPDAPEAKTLQRDRLLKVLDEVQTMIQEMQRSPVDKEKVKDIDRRLRYKKRKAQEEVEREEKDRAKAAKRNQAAQDDASVFD
ncbi:cyclin H [Rhodotorula toruloides]|uniref:Cyclin H n=1 Tax=Rhodotorula toruloides TaxID=5286 RepID=A0A511KC26_RHOTO|nr:cyclin H [Rhodotorula toruloides]